MTWSISGFAGAAEALCVFLGAVFASLLCFVWIMFESIDNWRERVVIYKRHHFTNSRRYILLFNHSLKITDPDVFLVFYFFASFSRLSYNTLSRNSGLSCCMQRGCFVAPSKCLKNTDLSFRILPIKCLIWSSCYHSSLGMKMTSEGQGFTDISLHGRLLCVWVFLIWR